MPSPFDGLSPYEAGVAVHETMEAIQRGELEPAFPDRISAADLCSRCSRPSDDLLDRAHGERVCHACRDQERARYEAATGLCTHGCGYDLAWHQRPRSVDDDCPTEAEARERSGAQ